MASIVYAALYAIAGFGNPLRLILRASVRRQPGIDQVDRAVDLD